MPVYITTPKTDTLYIDKAGQSWVVTADGSITAANGHGIVNNDAYHDSVITIAGDIVADAMYKSGISSMGADAVLKVDTGGSIHAYNGIAFYGEGTSVENVGHITAENIGIYGNAHDMAIFNEGVIQAKTGILVENATASMSFLRNSGTIHANNGILAVNGGVNITNDADGIIDAKMAAVTLGENSSDRNIVNNYGLIESADIAVLGSTGVDYVSNHGTIKGTVFLGDGNDSFDNSEGTIDHAVDGGLGDDYYGFGAKAFTIIDGGGSDTIGTYVTRSLTAYSNIENLSLEGGLNINGTGNTLANKIYGNSGDNILNGGNDNIVDKLSGGDGSDTYTLGSGFDLVYESEWSGIPAITLGSDDGVDTITSTISRSLVNYDNVENLQLLGTGHINGAGNYLANIITGTTGNNILTGGVEDHSKGVQIDTLNGGAGNDTYILGTGYDKVIDSAGNDTITSEISRSLASYPAIENLTLVGNANIAGTGNMLVNIITGNSGNNILNGGTDNVVDTLKGGLGNDIYVLGSGADIVSDGGGVDTITSTISRSLASYAIIENLTLSGSDNINATGNALANVLTGNAGTNTLNGGAGNDTYVLGSGADKVVDSAGIDTITSLITRNLSTFATIENLKLLGASNISGTGNALANTLTGNSGVNSLSGAAGNDVLIGGVGADKLDGGANIDTASYAGASAGVVANLTTAAANTGDAKGDVYVSIENLTGSSHNDTLAGNAGNNVLAGGTGADKLTGGAGADTFLFKALSDTTVATAGRDTIFDFSHTQGDKIGLSGIDANTAITGDQAFIFKGTAAFSGTNGELRFEKQASDTYVYGDTNGDKVADFIIHFDDAIAFQNSDFVF
ncbi:beta strand repeat-containing protein [Pararhizobium sp.]|uniref:beta strand repeat-containing protein n=1 Tax=Pararhizobium sp. TaxID=1977563 RepID=UPI003D14A5B3